MGGPKAEELTPLGHLKEIISAGQKESNAHLGISKIENKKIKLAIITYLLNWLCTLARCRLTSGIKDTHRLFNAKLRKCRERLANTLRHFFKYEEFLFSKCT